MEFFLLRRMLLRSLLLVLALPSALLAQIGPAFSPNPFAFNAETLVMEGGGQVEPSAYRLERFGKLSFFTGVSPMGLGEHMSTNLSPHVDLRIFGNRASMNTHHFSQKDFNIALNIGFANVGTFVDYYPFHKPFRISPGYLFYNGNRFRADLHANPNAVFTINNIDWIADNADPVHGTGRLLLGGNGFLITAGYGRYVSRSEKRFSFPFEAGVAFIDTPKASLTLGGQICSSPGVNCQPASTFPGFSSALAAQLVTWNKDVAPYHIYPIVEGGVAYTFRIRR